jgi:putative oxidoreductase
MTGRGMPMADVLLLCAIAIEIIGSAMLVFGWHARLGAAILAVFLTVATLYFHNYWSFPPGDQRNERNHFTKNIGFVGGLLVIVGLGAGRLSIDNRRKLAPARAA